MNDVELGDGKSVGEIVEALYKEELRRGAQGADIGGSTSLIGASWRRSASSLIGAT